MGLRLVTVPTSGLTVGCPGRSRIVLGAGSHPALFGLAATSTLGWQRAAGQREQGQQGPGVYPGCPGESHS